MFDDLPPARRQLLVGVGVLAAVAAVVVLTVAVLNRGPAVAPAVEDAEPPVLLVPGYGGSTDGLEVMADVLQEDGRTVQIVELGIASLGDLHRQADLIDVAVRDLRAETESDTVDLVAFSAGGIAARLWVDEHDGADVARRIVTLGSPHHGTSFAGVDGDLAPNGCLAACRQLGPDSTLIQSLNAGDETPAGPTWVSIWSDHDEAVVPSTSAELDGALTFSVQSVCPDSTVSHQGLPGNRVVIAMVERQIGREAPARPGASVCRAS